MHRQLSGYGCAMKAAVIISILICCACERRVPPAPARARMGATALPPPSPMVLCFSACPASPVDGAECRAKCLPNNSEGANK